MGELHELIPGFQRDRWAFLTSEFDDGGAYTRSYQEDPRITSAAAEFRANSGFCFVTIRKMENGRWRYEVEDASCTEGRSADTLDQAIDAATAFVTRYFRADEDEVNYAK